MRPYQDEDDALSPEGYLRVIPRDLFNEAKLLKCLGQLALIAHGHRILKVVHVQRDQHRGFVVEQDPTSGDLYSPSIEVYGLHDRRIYIRTQLNSKADYPAVALDDIAGELEVFDDTSAGHLSPEFCAAFL